MKKLIVIVIFTTIGLCQSINSHAFLITNAAGLIGTTKTIGFTQFVFPNEHEGVTGPVQIGGLVGEDIQASSLTSALWLHDGSWELVFNGNWTAGGRVG